VVGDARTERFLRAGRETSATIRDALARTGIDLEDFSAILDFGCGCGRVTRHWAPLTAPEVHGCDLNPVLVNWCQRNLPFIQGRRSGLEPPLPYPAGRFDLVYAVSVFTHLTEALQRRWMTELRRVVKPGGFLWFTTRGERYLDDLSKPELRRFGEGEMIVRHPESAGQNLCAAYHPSDWVVEHLVSGSSSLVEFAPGGTPGGRRQDYYLVQVGD
jgi:SAM-dependent methyltransferase